MFTELNSILNASPDSFTQGEFILVSVQHSDASFLIHHFLSFYLRARSRVCFLALVQSFSHYSAVSQRLGVNLTQAKDKGQLIFLEGLKESLSHLIPQEERTGSEAMDFLRDPAGGLRSLYQFVHSSLTHSGGGEMVEEEEAWGSPVLLVDDLSVLMSLGVSAGAVLDFSHYCRAMVCSQLQGNMVALVRCSSEEEEDEGDAEGSEWLRRGLTHQCSLTLHVQGLSTGYCRDIHGQDFVNFLLNDVPKTLDFPTRPKAVSERPDFCLTLWAL
ncbi:elongator complex protein 6 isoform X2 [Gouania willdenowi]|uniref:elongator complex protein 6 isoform X2 n=1 Tax=Gouania willdenowi TaxID=441366 RepID=UPI00105624DE|nr:elongator complex protein 6 isoform X2 [Gouania willdenowi]